MPLRDYHCKRCEETTERLVKHDAPPQKCDICGEELTRLVATGTSVRVNGASAANGYTG